ncbi:MAG: dihydroorotase [Cyanobacteriota bacterium]
MSSQPHLVPVRFLNPFTGQEGWTDLPRADIAALAFDPQTLPLREESADSPYLVLAPTLTDLYSYTGEPGYEHRETLASLSAAALAGGFTQAALLPLCDPVIDQPATLDLIQRHWQALPQAPRFHFWGALTHGAEGEQVSEWESLMDGGVAGFSDGRPLKNPLLLRRVLEYLGPSEKPIALVPTDLSLRGSGVARESADSLKLGLPGDPAASESAALAQILELLRDYPAPVHLMRLSTQRGVDLIAQAKAEGLPVTASVAWMHLLWDTEDLESYNPHLRLAPPLGTPQDRQALINGVKAGIIDAIAVDHRAYSYEEKTLAFADAPPGAVGFELALPLLWQDLVTTELLSALELWRALSVNPLTCLGLPQRVDRWLVFDPDQVWVANGQTLKTLGANTPYWGREIRGKVLGIGAA